MSATAVPDGEAGKAGAADEADGRVETEDQGAAGAARLRLRTTGTALRSQPALAAARRATSDTCSSRASRFEADVHDPSDGAGTARRSGEPGPQRQQTRGLGVQRSQTPAEPRDERAQPDILGVRRQRLGRAPRGLRSAHGGRGVAGVAGCGIAGCARGWPPPAGVAEFAGAGGCRSTRRRPVADGVDERGELDEGLGTFGVETGGVDTDGTEPVGVETLGRLDHRHRHRSDGDIGRRDRHRGDADRRDRDRRDRHLGRGPGDRDLRDCDRSDGNRNRDRGDRDLGRRERD